MRRVLTLIAGIILFALGRQAFAQMPDAPPAGSGGPPAQTQVVMPDAEQIVLLLRTTLVTLNDAIQTGNFTVLRRDLGKHHLADILGAGQRCPLNANSGHSSRGAIQLSRRSAGNG